LFEALLLVHQDLEALLIQAVVLREPEEQTLVVKQAARV
jgi:hypothetical protein